MTTEQQSLWSRIEAFTLDEPGAAFPFSERLAKENRWTPKRARRAIEEYKRFIFLGCAAGHSVSPPEDVDQVWRLHLVYTKSYWRDFCGQALRQPFDHQPTKGWMRGRCSDSIETHSAPRAPGSSEDSWRTDATRIDIAPARQRPRANAAVDDGAPDSTRRPGENNGRRCSREASHLCAGLESVLVGRHLLLFRAPTIPITPRQALVNIFARRACCNAEPRRRRSHGKGGNDADRSRAVRNGRAAGNFLRADARAA